MTALRALPLAALLLASTGCGAEVFYWKVTASEVTFSEACSDLASFRDGIHPAALTKGAYLTYKKSDDGDQAIVMDCTTTSASSCREATPPMVFTFEGDTATWTPAVEKTALTGSTCKLQNTQRWTFTEAGDLLSGKVELTFNLVDDLTACQAYEDAMKSASPNKKGIEGCGVTLAYQAVRY